MVNRNPKPGGDELQRLESDIAAQYALEKWWVEEAKARDLEYGDLLRESGRVSTDRGVRALITHLAEKLAIEIENRALNRTGNARFRKDYQILATLLDSIQPFELAHLVLMQTVNTLFTQATGFVTLAALTVTLADAVESELRMRAMVALEPDLPRLVGKVLKDSRASIQHRRRVFINLFHKKSGKNVPRIYTDNHTKIETGTALASLLFTVPQLASIEKGFDSKKREVRWVVRPASKLKDLFYREMDLSWLAKRTTPFGILLYKPEERKTKHDLPEMLLTPEVPVIKVNRLAGKLQSTIDTLRDNDYGFSTLMASITYLEQTPLTVNREMLAWVNANLDSLRTAGALSVATLNLPTCPLPKDTKPVTPLEEEKLLEWKKLCEKQHNTYWRNRVAVTKELRTIELATKMAEYPRFYTRWCSDFRGRLYTVNTLLSFQGTSLSKSLIEFAVPGKVIVGDSLDGGWRDIVEYGLRLIPKFAKVSETEIISQLNQKIQLEAQVEAFLNQTDQWPRYFTALGKKNFFLFAAWALEMKRLLGLWGASVSSGLPVRRDATCSSMQHMGAMAGDIGVLTATNCSGSVNEPQDLYSTIVPDYKEQGLERDWVKKFVMTYAYLATDFSRKNELQNSFEDIYGLKMPRQRAAELNDKIKIAADKGLGKVVDLQECLMEVYRFLVLENKLQALSNTPTGFVVDSTKYSYPVRRYSLFHYGTRIKVQMKQLEGVDVTVDKRGTRQAWVANIVHSMDAALLHIILHCFSTLKANRIHLATIHDCVVTRPGDMATVMESLEFAFRCMYTPNRKTGMAEVLHKLVDFWGLEQDYPELYERFVETFQGVKVRTFEGMRYFFL